MSKRTLTRKVRAAYRQDQLARILTLPEHKFGRVFGMTTVDVDQPYPHDYYHFKDNGSRVLAVAHLDTVVRPDRRKPCFLTTYRGPGVISGALDDRLGAYVILKLLPALGITCDWLLTVGEESGRSTAGLFKTEKDYDWVIEFDRGGTDVVMYQFEDDASIAAVEAAGAKVGNGSFSDIASLEHLGVKAFNWGAGYDGNYHSEDGYAYLDDTFGMVAKYLRFHAQNAGVAMPHEESAYGSGRSWWDDDSYRSGDYGKCASCGEDNMVNLDTGYCEFCGICQDCGATDPDLAAEWGDDEVDVCQCYTPRRAREHQDAGREHTVTWDEWLASRPDGPAAQSPPAIAPPAQRPDRLNFRPSSGTRRPTARDAAARCAASPASRTRSPATARTSPSRAARPVRLSCPRSTARTSGRSET